LKVAAIVPAYNEADRLGAVLEAIGNAALVDEIVVVNDGSDDNTSEVAKSHDLVRLVELTENRGKGGAMHAGASNTDAEVILFLDADLIGITGEAIDSIVRPVVDQEMDVCIGLFSGGRKVTDIAQVVAPYISGQRALPRHVFLDIPEIDTCRSGVEVAMSKYFRANGIKMGTVTIYGCTHVMKEEKLGFWRGTLARTKMYLDIIRITILGHRVSRPRRVFRGLKKLVRGKNAQRG
jgi:glycosyltransferase involved in cell wall biosynthesis